MNKQTKPTRRTRKAIFPVIHETPTRPKEALHESEEQYRDVVERARDGIAIIQDAIITYVNPRLAEVWGGTVDEIIGKPFTDFVYPDELPLLLDRYQRRMAGEDVTPTYETAFKRKDGNKTYTELNAGTIVYHGAPANLVIVRDITQRKRAEEALRESERHFHSLFDNATIGMYRTTPDGRILLSNHAAVHMLGFDSFEEMAKRNLEKDGSDAEYPRSQFRERMQNEGSVIGLESAWTKKDGSIIFVRESATAVQDTQGNILYYDGTFEDISARKLAEGELRLRVEELAALQATVLEITAPHDLHTLLQTITERAAQLVGARSGGLYLCDPGHREVRLAVSYHTPHDYTGTILRYGEGAAGSVAQTGKPLIIDDYRIWHDRATVFEGEQPFSAVLSAPMIWQDQVIGVIHVLNDVESRRFKQTDLALLTLFANHAAIAVENIRLYEEAQNEITERERVEEQLRESESSLQGILQSTADGILGVSSENKVLLANERFVEMWRIPQAVLATKDDSVLLQHVLDQLSDPQDFLQKIEQLYKSNEESLDTLYLKDGRTYERRSRPLIQEAELRGRVWSFHDMTERKRSEEQLAASESRYRGLFEDSPVSLWEEDFSAVKQRLDALRANGITDFQQYFTSHPEVVTDCEALIKVLDVNKATVSLFGANRKEEVLNGLAEILEGEATQVFQGELVNIAEGKTRFGWEGINRTMDGRPINIDLNWSAVPGYEKSLSKVLISVIDITERKQAEQALAESETKFKWLYEYAPVAYHILTPEGTITDVNRRWCELLGYPREEALGKAIFDLVVDEERDAAKASFERKKQSSQPYVEGNERNFRTKAGAVRTFKIYDFIELSEGQNISSIHSTLEDITERKRVEEGLRQAEANYRNIVDNAIEGIFQSTPAGQFFTANPALARMLGYDSPEELITGVSNISHEFYVLPARREEFVRQLSHHGMISNFESQVHRKDGSKIWISENARSVRGAGGQLHYEGTLVDITERKQAEEALRIAEANYRSLFENSPVGIYQVTPRGRPVAVNQALARIVGYDSPQELLKAIDSVEQQFYVDPVSRREFQRLIEEQGHVRDFSSQGRRRDSAIIWVQESAHAVRDTEGNSLYYEGFMTDITERKLADEELRRLSTHDTLTGLYNRGFFMGEMARLERGREFPISIVMADVDHLKRINDQNGHAVGDALLKRVAQVLTAAFRVEDVVARIGGDEFAVLLPGTDAAAAEVSLERVRRIIQENNAANAETPIRLSLGVSTAESPAPLSGVLQRADESMYREKRENNAS